MQDNSSQSCDLAIVICTYHREALLGKALDSVIAQECPADLRVSIFVVDNSNAGTAKSVVALRQTSSPFDLKYIAAHPANISVARNAGIEAAIATYIAFLDDDQEMQKGWLQAAASAFASFPHDAFFGAVEPIFEAPERATGLVRQLFSRRLDAPAGSELIAMGPDKTRSVALATCNSIFRRASIMFDASPFDAAFGHGGGEDYDLICRMQQRGCRFAWLPDARAHEYVPAHRCEPSYLRGRFYAGGQAFAAAVANTGSHPKLARWMLRIKACLQAALLAPQFPFKAWRGRDALTDYAYAWAGVLGKMSFSGIHPIYRQPAGKN